MEDDPLTEMERAAFDLATKKKKVVWQIAKILCVSNAAASHAVWRARKRLGLPNPPRQNYARNQGREINEAQECARCPLRGHKTEDCDLPMGAASFAGARRISQVDIEH